MILSALVERLKRRSKDDFKGRHFEATLILQAVSWYLRPISYRNIEELFLERGLAWLPLISAVLWRRSKVALGRTRGGRRSCNHDPQGAAWLQSSPPMWSATAASCPSMRTAPSGPFAPIGR